jgi:hypothetical protein
MIGILGVTAIVAALTGYLATKALADRLQEVAPDIHASLGSPTSKTPFVVAEGIDSDGVILSDTALDPSISVRRATRALGEAIAVDETAPRV